MSVFNTTFTSGMTFIDARDSDTNEAIKETPKYTYDISLAYDDLKSFRASLRGRYIWWNADAYWNSKYSNFVVDLNATKTLYKLKDQRLEVFLSGS